MKSVKWIIFFLGLWVMTSPWILGFSAYTLAMWSNIAVGVLILVASLWEIFGKTNN